MSFPFWPYPLDPARPRNKHEALFWGVHTVQPLIYSSVERQAHLLLAMGRSHYGIKEFFEGMRWESSLAMNGEPFKINNNYPAYYARLWLQNNPAHWDFFALRRVRGEYPFEGIQIEIL